MHRLLGRTKIDNSHDAITSSPNPALPVVYRLSAAQNAAYQAGAAIEALDRSPDGRCAVLASDQVLRIVRLNQLKIEDHADLRPIITAQSLGGKTGSISQVGEQLSIQDVKWATSSGGAPSLFTACSSGKIFVYDISRSFGAIGRPGSALETITIKEDLRQVKTLDINPHRDSWLLSGSKDGFVRCFDTRDRISARGGGVTFGQMHIGKCNDVVNHVKWSPKEGFFFACCTESGAVMKWDCRVPTKPVLRLNAHEANSACTAVAWHHDGDHLASAGTDGKIHVWDASAHADKRQKPRWTISSPDPVASIAWRPGQWSARVNGRRAAQIAVSYSSTGGGKRQTNGVVHLWDFARPTMPYKEIDRFDVSPSALLWMDPDLLWTAGKDGIFSQCDVAFAPKVIDRTPVSTMSFSPRGDVVMFLDERTQPRRPRVPASLHRIGMLPPSSTSSGANGSSSPTAAENMFSMGRSDSEDEVLNSFLGQRKTDTREPRSRRASIKSPGPLVSTTPPSAGVPHEPAVPLEASLNVAGMYRNSQSMSIGPLPAARRADTYQFLTQQYLETLEREFPHTAGGTPLVERVTGILEHYARAAECVSQFRLAQTWRILAFAMDLLLKSRAQYHLQKRLTQPKQKPVVEFWNQSRQNLHDKGLTVSRAAPARGDLTPRRVAGSGSHAILGRSLLTEEFESTSNVPTPLARPIGEARKSNIRLDDDLARLHHAGDQLEAMSDVDNLSLPAAAHPHLIAHDYQRRRLDSTPLSEASHDSDNTQASITEGYDFYDMDAMAKAMDVPPPKEQPVAFPSGYTAPSSPLKRRYRSVARHDSADSLANMFTISETSGGSFSTANESPSQGELSTSVRRSSRYSGPTSAPSQNLSGSPSAGEYQSRIRGRNLNGSPVFSPLSQLHQQRTMLPTGTITTQPSEEDDPYKPYNTQTTADSESPRTTTFRAPLGGVDQPNPSQNYDLPRHPPKEMQSRLPAEMDESPEIVEGDYLPWQDDPSYPFPTGGADSSETTTSQFSRYPLQPYALVLRALDFELKSSALNASAIILVIKPLMPDGLIDANLANTILRQHHSRLMGMRLFVEAALLRKLCVRGWPGGVLEEQWIQTYPAVFSQAQQGVSVAFFCVDCKKPRDVDRSSTSNDAVWLRCKKCRTPPGPCPICGHREAPNMDAHDCADDGNGKNSKKSEPFVATWWYCPTCAHGGHATCMSIWHGTTPSQLAGGELEPPEGFSDGCCPVDGCGHACLPGRWRSESMAARTEEVSRSGLREVAKAAAAATRASYSAGPSARGSPVLVPGSTSGGHLSGLSELTLGQQLAMVRGDAHEVAQSRAVDGVREALLGGGGGGGLGAVRRAGSASLSSSPGRAAGLLSGLVSGNVPFVGGGERERRKSVKFASADERR